MESWTKYVLDNEKNDKVLHYCVEHLMKDIVSARDALAKDKNQLATELVCDMTTYMELLQALDNKINGGKKTTVVA